MRILIGVFSSVVLVVTAHFLSQAAEVDGTKEMIGVTLAALKAYDHTYSRVSVGAITTAMDYAVVAWDSDLGAGSTELKKVAGKWSILAMSTGRLNGAELLSLGVPKDAVTQLNVASALPPASDDSASKGLHFIPVAFVAVSQPSGEFELRPDGSVGISGETKPTLRMASHSTASRRRACHEKLDGHLEWRSMGPCSHNDGWQDRGTLGATSGGLSHSSLAQKRCNRGDRRV
jgi:hypothetical protein